MTRALTICIYQGPQRTLWSFTTRWSEVTKSWHTVGPFNEADLDIYTMTFYEARECCQKWVRELTDEYLTNTHLPQ